MPIFSRFIVISCLMLSLLLIGASPRTSADTSDMRIRFNISPKGYPPFMIIYPDGSHGGIIWDLLTLVANRHGYEVEALEVPRKRVDGFILEGRLDATARAIEWTKAPEKFAFTEPLIQVEEVFFKRINTPFDFTDTKALTGKTIITHLGYEYPALAPIFHGGGVNRFDVQHDVEMLHHLLVSDQFDLAVAVREVGLWHIREQGWKGELDYIPQPLSQQGYRLMFRKDQQAFVELFNLELTKLRASGEWKAIVERYR